jgi:hypothetical protein
MSSIASIEDNRKTSDNSPLIENKYYSNNKEKKILKKSDFEKKKKKDIVIIELIYKILKEIIEDNKNEFSNNCNSSMITKTVFYMKNLPNMKFIDYIKRINKYLKPESSSLILALIYIDRICSEKENNVILIDNNIFKLFLIALTLAIKYNEDFYDDNAYFAKVGGIDLKEINIIEKEFLNLIDFRLFVSDDIFNKYKTYLLDY